MLHVIVACSLLCQEPQPPKPGKHHEHLKAFAGTWTYTATFNFGGTPSKSSGTSNETMSPDGLWLVMDTRNDAGDFWGHGIVGFDSSKNKYVGVWVDSMGDYLSLSEGECSDDGKTQTVTTEVKGPDGKAAKLTQTSKIIDADHKTMTMTMAGPDGKTMEIGKIEYTRKK